MVFSRPIVFPSLQSPAGVPQVVPVDDVYPIEPFFEARSDHQFLSPPLPLALIPPLPVRSICSEQLEPLAPLAALPVQHIHVIKEDCNPHNQCLIP